MNTFDRYCFIIFCYPFTIFGIGICKNLIKAWLHPNKRITNAIVINNYIDNDNNGICAFQCLDNSQICTYTKKYDYIKNKQNAYQILNKECPINSISKIVIENHHCEKYHYEYNYLPIICFVLIILTFIVAICHSYYNLHQESIKQYWFDKKELVRNWINSKLNFIRTRYEEIPIDENSIDNNLKKEISDKSLDNPCGKLPDNPSCKSKLLSNNNLQKAISSNNLQQEVLTNNSHNTITSNKSNKEVTFNLKKELIGKYPNYGALLKNNNLDEIV